MAVVKTSGLGDRYFVGGYDLSGDTREFGSIHGGPAPLEYTDITQSAHARNGGMRDGGITWTSYFDKSAGQAHAALSALTRNDVNLTYCHGVGIGNSAASMVAKQIGYDPTRPSDGSLAVAVAAQSNGYGLEWGLQLTAGLRTDTVPTNGASLDNAASTAFGAQFYLNVTAFTGTSVLIKIQDSADNAAWADLASAAFTSVTAIGAERIAISNAATVRRYMRVVTSGTFSSASFVVNSVRNLTAGQVF